MTAVVAGGAARLALGTSAGHLEIDEVERLVSAIGVQLATIGESERRRDGELVIPAVTESGMHVIVKVHGRDAVESRFANRLWRAALVPRRRRDADGAAAAGPRRRDAGDPARSKSRGAGVGGRGGRPAGPQCRPDGAARARAPAVRGRCACPRTWCRRHGTRSARCTAPGSPTSGWPRARWWCSPTAGSVSPTSATPSSVPAADQIATDEAQLLVTLAALVGAETATRESIALIGTGRTMDLLPFLQSAAFGGELRRDVRAAGVDLDELRTAALRETGEDEPVLARLRRVSLGGLIQTALLVLAASAIITLLTGLDFDQLRQSLRERVPPAGSGRLPRRADAALRPGRLDARLGAGTPAVRAGVRDAARDVVHEPRAAVGRGADGAQRAVLPAAGRATCDGRHVGADRLAGRQRDPGRDARAPAAVLTRRARRHPRRRCGFGRHGSQPDRADRAAGARRLSWPSSSSAASGAP